MKALDKTLKPLLKFLDGYYAKLPALPKNVDEGLVSLAPWLALIGGLLSLFAAYGLYSLMTSPYVAMFANVGGVEYRRLGSVGLGNGCSRNPVFRSVSVA